MDEENNLFKVNTIRLNRGSLARLALVAMPREHLLTVWQVVHDPLFDVGNVRSNRFLTSER